MPARAAPLLLSAMQLKRALRKSPVLHIAVLRPTNESTSTATVAEQEGLVPEHELNAILDNFADVFPSELPAELPPRRGFEGHTIPTEPGAQPPFRPMYRLSEREKHEMQRQITDLLAKGYIEPSQSPYGAPILFVSKKDGSLRMCMDWRALNKVTIKNRYPLPRIDDLLDQLNGATVFSGLDLTSGYHQIRISDEDVPKTAFRTPLGHFQWKVLSFGLTNAPATFQAAMNRMMAPYIGKFVLVYLDDILVYSKTAEEHARHLELVLAKLREHRFFANRAKCSFNKPELEFLGHIVGREGVRVDPKKVQVVRDWIPPKDAHGVRRFLGLSNYFRRFIHQYSEKALPLTRLLRTNAQFHWGPEQQQAFEAIKQALTTAPVLAMPDFTKPFTVVTDASDQTVGGVLLQEQRAIAYESRQLIAAERNYTVSERELLAVVHCLQVWRCYLEGSDFDVITDHKPNTYLQSQATLSGRQARWSEFLQRFVFNWVYKPGSSNIADPLTRMAAMALMVMTRSRLRTDTQAAGSVPQQQVMVDSSADAAAATATITTTADGEAATPRRTKRQSPLIKRKVATRLKRRRSRKRLRGQVEDSAVSLPRADDGAADEVPEADASDAGVEESAAVTSFTTYVWGTVKIHSLLILTTCWASGMLTGFGTKGRHWWYLLCVDSGYGVWRKCTMHHTVVISV